MLLLRRTSQFIIMIGCGAQLLASGWPFEPSDQIWKFDRDPTEEGIVLSGLNDGIWVHEGGNPDGFLALTYPEPDLTGFVVFPKSNNDIIHNFKLQGEIRLGNSTGPRAADGFSISLARDNGTDPVVVDLNDNQGRISEQFNFAGGIAEGGTVTGVSVSFDTWAGNTLPDGPDIEGVIVRVDNVTVARSAMPTRHGECSDVTSLQTGPRNQPYWDLDGPPRHPDSWEELCWQPFSVELDHDAKLTITFKGLNILTDFQTNYFPTKSRLILAGRTGGANQHTHFDNIRLVTNEAPPEVFQAPPDFRILAAGARRMRLAWNHANLVERVAYEIEKNGEILSGFIVGQNTFEDQSIIPGRTYRYRIRMVNIAGQRSSFSLPLTVVAPLEVESKGFLRTDLSPGIKDLKFVYDPEDVTQSIYVDGLHLSSAVLPANSVLTTFGTLTPNQTGDYRFFLMSDEPSAFHLNPNGPEFPSITQSIPIATVQDSALSFKEPDGNTPETSESISLVEGISYGFVVVLKQGDNQADFKVAWRLEGDSTPVAELQPIHGAVVTGYVDPVGADIQFVRQPQDVKVGLLEKATFSVRVETSSPYLPITRYQWFRDNKPILGADRPSYSISTATRHDHGTSFKCQVMIPGRTVFSDEATLGIHPTIELVELKDQHIVIHYHGNLMQASTAKGPYAPVIDAISPYIEAVESKSKFFKVVVE